MVVFLCGGGIGFPNGTAPTARVMAYARGLQACGSPVKVLCLGTSEIPAIGIFNRDVHGNHNGIEFEYVCGTTVRGRSFFHRRWLAIRGPLLAAWRVFTSRKVTQIDALILYPDTLLTAILFWVVAKLCRAVYLLEKSEQPFLQAEHSRWWKLYGWVYTHTVFRLFDGVIVISNFLQNYMTNLLHSTRRIFKIPILVDLEQFTGSDLSGSANGRYIAYCGTLNEAKDGVWTLLRAFAAISAEFPDVQLYLIGDAYHTSQIPHFREKAKELAIEARVHFTGTVSRDRLPHFLGGATVLALARPSSAQAAAGFPTKLGEYLATGNPVVVTRTGEVDRFLEDGLNAFLAAPDDVAAFSSKLREALSDIAKAREIGQRGRAVAQQYFDYRTNSKRLQGFIQKLRI